MIEILNPAQVDRARRTGALVADILQTLRSRSEVGTNLLDLDRWTAEMIREAGAESCRYCAPIQAPAAPLTGNR